MSDFYHNAEYLRFKILFFTNLKKPYVFNNNENTVNIYLTQLEKQY